MRRLVPVVAILTTAALLFSSVTPAAACSCAYLRAHEMVEFADVIAVGTVTRIDAPDFPRGVSFATERYLKGTGPSEIEVKSALPQCGFIPALALSDRYVLFAQLQAGEYSSSVCHGNLPLAADADFHFPSYSLAEIEALTGHGEPPIVDSPVELNYGQQFFGEDIEPANPPNALMWLAAAAVPIAFLAGATLAPWRRR